MSNQEDWKAYRVNSNEGISVRGWMINDRYLDYGLSRYVFALIYGYSSYKNGQYCTFAVQHMAEMVNVDRRTITNLVNYLLDIGYIKRSPINGKRYKYWALTEEEIEELNNGRDIHDNGKPFPINGKSIPINKNGKSFPINEKPFPINEKPFPPNKKHINNTLYKKSVREKEKPKKPKTHTLKEKPFVKPSVQEIQTYAASEGLTIDAEYFWNYYESVGWYCGKTPMQDWKMAVFNWVKREKKFNKGKRPRSEPDFKQNTYDYDALEAELVQN
jgi:DNA-binding MarR family transcriptional regulator